jgi:hypothetical protein
MVVPRTREIVGIDCADDADDSGREELGHLDRQHVSGTGSSR